MMISINAEIASAKIGALGQPFGVVAREMRQITEHLASMMQEIEGAFQQAILHVARWFRHEKELQLFTRGVGLCDRAGEPAPTGTAMSPALRADAAPAPDEPPPPAPPAAPAADGASMGDVVARLRDQQRRMQQQMAAMLETVRVSTTGIHRTLSDMSLSIGRESRFLGIFAKIEAARIDDEASNIASVAAAIETLANEIDGALALARSKF